jgi:hypothetical protein
MKHTPHLLLTSLGLGLLLATAAHGQMVNHYVGIDGRAVFPSGTYAGKDNPNYGRLTLLYAHHYEYGRFSLNHYHPIGVYTLTGAADSPTVNDTSAGNRLPEVYTGLPGVTLVPDTNAIWAGKLISKKHEEHYSDMRFRSVHHLATFGQGSSERFMYLSSGGTRTNLMTDAQLALELVSKSEGLNIAAADGTPILQEVGSTQVIGDGNDANFEYLPVFWVDAAAAPGAYHAEFRLVDLNTAGGRTPFASSGRFFLDFSVPEPTTVGIAATVTLTVPLVTLGHVLEAAPEVSGPWEEIPMPPAENTLHTQTRTTRELSLPVSEARAFYRLRRVL